MEQIDLLNLACTATALLLTLAVLAGGYIIFEMIESVIMNLLHRRHYRLYRTCLTCDHHKMWPADLSEHRFGCWKNGDPNNERLANN